MEKGVITVVSAISSTLSDGLDPRELLCLPGGGSVTADWLPGILVGLDTGTPGTDSGLLSWVGVFGTAVLLSVCVLERRGKVITLLRLLIASKPQRTVALYNAVKYLSGNLRTQRKCLNCKAQSLGLELVCALLKK